MPLLSTLRLRQLRQFVYLGCGDGKQDRSPSLRERTQAKFGTVADALPRTGRADPVRPDTFDTKRSAEQWLTLMESRILRGDGGAGRRQGHVWRLFDGWIADRRLEPRSRELYLMLLRLHIMPWFADRPLDRISPQSVRSWRTDLLSQGRSELTAAKSYRLLRGS